MMCVVLRALIQQEKMNQFNALKLRKDHLEEFDKLVNEEEKILMVDQKRNALTQMVKDALNVNLNSIHHFIERLFVS